MLKKNKLLIDKDCPMCRIYGAGFTQMKLVDKDTVMAYQTAEENIFAQIDQERAKSEIALYDTVSNKTIYGADAFMKILAGENHLLKWLFSWSIIRFLGSKLYRCISFNRHVITGAPELTGKRDCMPSVHKGYRWLFIILTASFTGFVVNQFAVILDVQLHLNHLDWREYLICFGQVVWQFIALSLIDSDKRLDYLGNMSTVSLIGALLLLPLLGLNAILPLNWMGLVAGFMAIVGFMFFIHLRRCSRLGLPFITSLSWVIFRSTVLILIVFITT